MEGFSSQVTFFAVFIEGALSFFSPCILPLLPLYIGYLAGDAAQERKSGRVVFHTAAFVAGISAAFFLLGMAFTGLGAFLRDYQSLIGKVGGAAVILLGLFQIGFLQTDWLLRERRLRLPFAVNKMNGGIAFLLGFTFSFAWTPCVGPALSSVLLLASSVRDAWLGNALIGVYAAGFLLPFLFLGMFTTRILSVLRRRQHYFSFLTKLGGVILIAVGLLMFTGYTERLGASLGAPDTAKQKEEVKPQKQAAKPPAVDFTLTDQYGKVHTLSEYKGKTVFLNFWATWCPPCRQEMPHIEALYRRHRQEDVVVLAVANPRTAESGGQDISEVEIKTFLQQNGYTFPVLFDRTGQVFRSYWIRALPTTYMIDREGNVFGYVSGALEKQRMEEIVQKTLESR